VAFSMRLNGMEYMTPRAWTLPQLLTPAWRGP